MQIFLYLCTRNLKNAFFMNDFLKYLGVVLLLLGVVCLIVYRYACPVNGLLIASMVLEVSGILAFIFINKALR
jgi:hypothetical protein